MSSLFNEIFFFIQKQKTKYLAHDFQWAIFETIAPFLREKRNNRPDYYSKKYGIYQPRPQGFSRPTHLREKPWGRGWVFTIPFLWKMIYKPRRVLWLIFAGLVALASQRPWPIIDPILVTFGQM